MRLRTLPLSLAGIVTGIGLAATRCQLDWMTVSALILTALALQILSNLSNELGDTLSGTDTDQRQGIHYSLQDGIMTIKDMKILIVCFALLCVGFGLCMIHSAFGGLNNVMSYSFIGLGAAAIWAATRYTLGKHPYGYHGFGDIAVFIFFGFATTAGGYIICRGSLDSQEILIPAAAIGCFSVGVLNVNNIRDMKTDAATRTTLAIMMGPAMAKLYQTVLILLGLAFMITYSSLAGGSLWRWMYVITLPLYIRHLYVVYTRKDRDLDSALPLLVMATFAFAVLASVGMNIS